MNILISNKIENQLNLQLPNSQNIIKTIQKNGIFIKKNCYY